MHVAHSTLDTEYGLPRPLSRTWAPLWTLVLLALWWITYDVATAAIAGERAPDLSPGMLRIGVTAGVLFKALGTAAEAGFYSAWWNLKGVRIPFGTLWVWLLSLSALDMLATLVALFAEGAPPVARAAIAVVCGARAITPTEELPARPLAVVFGSLGALTLARVAMTGWLQARATGRRLAGPLALTGTVWLALRLAMWWLSDLARGQSARFSG